MKTIIPHLWFDKEAEEAVAFDVATLRKAFAGR